MDGLFDIKHTGQLYHDDHFHIRYISSDQHTAFSSFSER